MEEKEIMEIVYWIILIVWILLIKILKKDSGKSLLVAFSLFLVAAILTVLNLQNLAEPIMRVSLIGWIIGIFHALIEYKKSQLNKSEQL